MRQLQANPEYYDQMISLVERSFGYESGHSVTQDFAPLFSKKSKAQNLLFFSASNELIGHIGVLHKKIVYKNHEYPVLFIGGVCVSGEFRGQGKLKEMMSQTLSLYEGQYMLALLWSSMTSLYEKFGFYEAGEVVQTGNHEFTSPPEGFHKISLSECPINQWSWIQQAYNKRKEDEAYVKREAKDWDVIKEMDSVSLYLSPDSQEYFMLNKGMDLPGIIHEYSPQTKLSQELAQYPVWTHPHKAKLASYVQNFYLSFMKLGDPKELATFMHHYSNNTIEFLNHKDGMASIKIEHEIQNISSKEFLRSIFGPGAPLSEELGHICFTIGGVDSV